MIKVFFKDSIVYTLPSLVSRGISFLLLPLYTRVLSPGDYGSLDLFSIFSNIVNLTIALEITQAVARFYPSEQNSNRKKNYASSALWFTLLCYSVFTIIMFLYEKQFTSIIFGQSGFSNVYRFGVLYILMNGIFYLFQNQLKWELRSRDFAKLSMTMSIISALSALFFGYYLHYGLLGFVFAMFLGNLLANIYGFYLLRKTFNFQFSFSFLREMLFFSSPLVLSGVAVWISLYIDRLLINKFLSLNEVGIYAIANRIASISTLLMVGFQGALTPLIYSNYTSKETPPQIAQIFNFFTGIALLVFLVGGLYSEIILKIFAGKDYLSADILIPFLIPAILLSNMYIFAPGIGIAKKNYYIVWFNLIGGVINFGLCIILLPNFGVIGAAISILIASLTVFILQVIVSQNLYPIPYDWGGIIFKVFFSILIVIIFRQLNKSFNFPMTFNFIGIFFFLGFLFKKNSIYFKSIANSLSFFKRNS